MPQHTHRESTSGAAPWVPDQADLEALRTAVQECRGCELDELDTEDRHDAYAAMVSDLEVAATVAG